MTLTIQSLSSSALGSRSYFSDAVQERCVPDSWSLLGFVAAALVLLLTPGPGVLYVVARSVEQGRRAGLVSVLGLSAGALVHVGAAAAGISAILLASATAFGVVKALARRT